MARKGEISTRFKLEGEREFNAAIKDAANNIKVLNSEQKLAEAQFNATGDAEEYAAEKARILKEKIAEQNKIVEACQKAIKKMTDSGVKENSEEMVKWKTKLNNAKTSLVNLETQLGKAEKGVEDTGTEMKNSGGKIDDYKDKLESTKSQLNLLDEELKLAQSEFQTTGNKEAFAASKAEILKKKIAAQKEQVAICEEAIKSMTENGVDPNSEEMIKWKTKLVNAKTSLNNLERELGEVEDGMGDAGSATDKSGGKIDDYKGKLDSTKSELNLLDEELKLAQSEFNKTGNKEAFAASKAEILKKKIAAQKEQVAICEEAIKSMTENGVDPNSEEMVKWKTKLVNAKTSLNNMERELSDVENGLEDTNEDLETGTSDSGKFQDALEKIGDNITFDNLKEALSSVTGFLEGLIQKAAQAAKAVWDASIEASEWADEVATNAETYGIDAETYQAMVYASRFVDTDVDKIFGSITRLEKDMGSASEEMAKAFNVLHVVTRNTDGSVRDSTEVFWDTIDALSRIEDETQRSIYAQSIFGSSWEELNPLIRAGSKAYKEYMEVGRKVAVISNDNVEALADLNDSYEDMQAVWEKTKLDTLAAIAPVMKEVADALKLALLALNDFIQSEEGREAITALQEALKGIISSFLGEDGGKESFQKIVNTAKEAVSGFTSALSWIADNGNTVKGIIEALAVAWAACKVSSTVITFLQLAKSLPTGKLSSLANIFGSAGGNAAASSAVTGGTSALGGGATAAVAGGGGTAAVAGGTGATVGTAMNATVLANAMAGLVPLGVLAVGIIPAYLAQEADNRRTAETLAEMSAEAEEAAAKAGEAGDAAKAAADVAIAGLGLSGKNVVGQDIYSDAANVSAALDVVAGMDDLSFLSGESQLMLERYEKGLLSAQDTNALLWKVANESIEYMESPGGNSGGTDISDTLDQLIELKEMIEEDPAGSEGGLYGTIRSLAEDKDVLAALSDETRDLVGAWLDPESGFGSGSATVFSDSMDLLDRMMEDLQDTWDKTHAAGASIPDGMAAGINDNAGAAEDAAADMATGTIDAAKDELDSHSPSRVFRTLGENAAVGMANGIYARGWDAINAARWLADSITSTIQAALQINSPSKVMESLGEYTGIGFAEGIEGTVSRVEDAVVRMAGATARRAVYPGGAGSAYAAMGGGAGAGDPSGRSGSAGNYNAVIVMDKTVVGRMVAPAVNDTIGATINAMRR